MSELDRLQARMADALRGRRALSKDPEMVRFASEIATGNRALSPVEQLEIYRQQYWLRHTEGLIEDFPGLGGILGQADWERLVEEYLLAHPPRSFTLRDLGEALPGFVAERCAWLSNREIAADMARLEWIYIELFDAADVPPLSPELLAQEGDRVASARLELAPTLRLLRTEYPVRDLRKRLLADTHDPVALPARDPENLLVYRAELTTRHELLESAPFVLLQALEAGSTLDEACRDACALGEPAAASVAANVGSWFAEWTRRGFIVGLRAD